MCALLQTDGLKRLAVEKDSPTFATSQQGTPGVPRVRILALTCNLHSCHLSLRIVFRIMLDHLGSDNAD